MNVSPQLVAYNQFALVTPLLSVTVTCGIQPTGVVTMTMECYMLVVTCVLLICLICIPSGFRLLAYISDKIPHTHVTTGTFVWSYVCTV